MSARKGGRPKRLWDVQATIDAITQVIGSEADDDGRAALGEVGRLLCQWRAYGRLLLAGRPYLAAVGSLGEALKTVAAQASGLVGAYDRAFADYEPVRQFFIERLGADGVLGVMPQLAASVGERGQDLRRLLDEFVDIAGARPLRIRRLLAELDKELSGDAPVLLRQWPFRAEAWQAALRSTILGGLHSLGWENEQITMILDPGGYRTEPKTAMDRIRKELSRLKQELPQMFPADGEPLGLGQSGTRSASTARAPSSKSDMGDRKRRPGRRRARGGSS